MLRRTAGALAGPLSKTENGIAAVLAAGLALLTLGSFFLRNRQSIAAGGSDFLHGDWLINYAGGPVRRGLGGEIVFFLSDLTGLAPLAVVEIVQIASVLVPVAAVLWALRVFRAAPAIIVLVVNPAFFLFWHNEFGETHVKEAFACLVFLPLLAAAFGSFPVRAAYAASLALYVVASLVHESAILFAPALAASGLALCLQKDCRRPFAWFLAGLFVLGAGLCLVTLNTYRISDLSPLCAALAARDVPPEFCQSTPIQWLAVTSEEAFSFTAGRLAERPWPRIAAAFVLAYLPLVYLLRRERHRTAVGLALLVNALAFVPLYIVAVDYGRWLNMQIAAAILSLLVAAGCGVLSFARQEIPRAAFWLLLGLALSWRVSLYTGGVGAGVLKPAVRYLVGS